MTVSLPHNVRRTPPRRASAAAALLLGWAAAGCGVIGGGPVADVKSTDPAERIVGMKQAADRKDRSALPEMVAGLDSEDPAERLFAIESLRRLAGQSFGYDYWAEPEARRPAVVRWKEWLKARPTK